MLVVPGKGRARDKEAGCFRRYGRCTAWSKQSSDLACKVGSHRGRKVSFPFRGASSGSPTWKPPTQTTNPCPPILELQCCFALLPFSDRASRGFSKQAPVAKANPELREKPRYPQSQPSELEPAGRQGSAPGCREEAEHCRGAVSRLMPKSAILPSIAQGKPSGGTFARLRLSRHAEMGIRPRRSILG